METLTLDCWVHGEYVERIFPVEISRTRIVRVLKEVIKDKISVKSRDVDACDLDPYFIRLPDDELNQWTLSGNPRLNLRLRLLR
ncbi:hypothetical protein F5I97DRAFT_1799354 [Phlebopus sp. FC_14]|nr:hypothetical protein F5I97DRAFT_1799354 [Phlebopus sp. FC_14]